MIVPAQLPQENGVKQRRRVLPITFLTIEGTFSAGKKKRYQRGRVQTCVHLIPSPFFILFLLYLLLTQKELI